MKSAEEHIEAAERLLNIVRDTKGVPFPLSHMVSVATIAQSHAVVAQAISLNRLANNYAEGG